MGDGPYRESHALVVERPRRIVRADESRSPSQRLRIVDYSDDGLRCELLGHTSSQFNRAFTYVVVAASTAVMALAAMTHAPLLGFPIVAVFALSRALLARDPYEELMLQRGAVVSSRAGIRRTLPLYEVQRFVATNGAVRIDTVTEGTASLFAALDDEAPLGVDELAWLTGRLNRALERVKR